MAAFDLIRPRLAAPIHYNTLYTTCTPSLIAPAAGDTPCA